MKKKVFIKSFIALALTASAVAGGVVASSGLRASDNREGQTTTRFALTNPTLSQTEVNTYQNQLPGFASLTTVGTGTTQRQAYSISEFFISAYDTKAKFEAAFRQTNGSLSFQKNTCDVVLKDVYKTTNNCGFLMSLLQMNEVRRSLETTSAIDLFTTTNQGAIDWVINPAFFDDDGDSDDRDNNYLYLNYLPLPSLGFTKEEITAIPFFLAYNMGVEGVSATNLSISTFPSANPVKEMNLNLANNPISVYPQTLNANANYARIIISGTNLGALQTLPTIFGSAEELDFGDNGLQSISPAFVQSLTNVTRLNFGNNDSNTSNNNQLSALPTEFSSIAPNLILLNLRNNSFVTNPLTPHVGTLNAIENLDLSGNQISVLGDLSGIADTLKTLDISSINLSSLGTSLNGFGELISLVVSGNSLVSLPADIGTQLPKLEGISVGNNQLTTLPTLPTTLKTLLVNDNTNLVFGSALLNTLVNLEVLNLSSTMVNLTDVNFGLTKLTTAIFNNIGLTATPNTLVSLPTLEIVSFSDNQINELIIGPSWKRVSYLNNPIQTISTFGLETNSELKNHDNAQFSYYDVSPNLEAIVFSINQIDFAKMTDTRILKLRLPFFWSQSFSQFFTTPVDTANPSFITIPISALNSIPEANRATILQGLPLVISTTLEFEYISSLATSALNIYNQQASTSYTYANLVNTNLQNNFSQRYQGPENFSTVADYTTSINTEVKNVFDLLQNQTKFAQIQALDANLNAQNQNVAQGRLTLIVLTIVAVVLAILLTCGSLVYLSKKRQRN